MKNNYYSYPSRIGDVVVCRNKERPSRWDLLVGGKLICPEYYTDPHQAAFFASRRDFGDEELNKQYVGLRVPSDLARWRQRETS